MMFELFRVDRLWVMSFVSLKHEDMIMCDSDYLGSETAAPLVAECILHYHTFAIPSVSTLALRRRSLRRVTSDAQLPRAQWRRSSWSSTCCYGI
jgi:hypothetical protein